MTADQTTQPLDVAETGTPAEWADVARHKYEHYRKLCDAYEAGGENAPALVAIDVHERHLAEMVPQLVDAIDSLAAELAQAHAVIDATRQMAIEANASLRAQLLAALDREDDGRTSLSTYVSHLVAQRAALKWSVEKAADEEERLRESYELAHAGRLQRALERDRTIDEREYLKVELEELRAEMDAARTGLGQIFLDPPGLYSPRIPGANDGEPVLYLQLTHQGIPVWICPDCVRMSVAESQPKTCRNCGYEGDDIGEAFHADVVFEDDAAVDAEYGAAR